MRELRIRKEKMFQEGLIDYLFSRIGNDDAIEYLRQYKVRFREQNIMDRYLVEQYIDKRVERLKCQTN